MTYGGKAPRDDITRYETSLLSIGMAFESAPKAYIQRKYLEFCRKQEDNYNYPGVSSHTVLPHPATLAGRIFSNHVRKKRDLFARTSLGFDKG